MSKTEDLERDGCRGTEKSEKEKLKMLFVARYPFCHVWIAFHSPECNSLNDESNTSLRLRIHTSDRKTLTGTTGNWTTEVFNGCDSRDEISFDYSSKLCVCVCVIVQISLFLSLVSHSIFSDLPFARMLYEVFHRHVSVEFLGVCSLPLHLLINPLLPSSKCWPFQCSCAASEHIHCISLFDALLILTYYPTYR